MLDNFLVYLPIVIAIASAISMVLAEVAPRTKNIWDDRIFAALIWLKNNVFDKLALNTKAVKGETKAVKAENK